MNIVLAHGILGFSHFDSRLVSVDYFAGVANHLRAKFCAQVIAPAVDKTHGTDVRSPMLRQAIQDALSRWTPKAPPLDALNPTEPIHIIAHSMGGLDARRLICQSTSVAGTPIKMLATIGTPHLGSPVADFVTKGLIAPELAQKFLSHFDISLDGLHELTSTGTAEFNAKFPDQAGVRYLLYAGRGREKLLPTSNFFLAYHAAIRLGTHEENDGLVTVSSATRGHLNTELWPSDHADEVGHDLDHPLDGPAPDLLERYSQIVKQF